MGRGSSCSDTGLLQSRRSFLASQSMQSFVELRGKFPPRLRQIGGTAASQQSPCRVGEYGQQMGCLSHAQLAMIFAHGGVASRMQALLSSPVSAHQAQETGGIRLGGRQTRDAIAYFVLRAAQRLGALTCQLEGLCPVWPRTVARKLAAHRDRAFLQPSMAFLHSLGLTEIHRGSRPARPAQNWLKERLDLVIEPALMGVDHPQIIPLGGVDSSVSLPPYGFH